MKLIIWHYLVDMMWRNCKSTLTLKFWNFHTIWRSVIYLRKSLLWIHPKHHTFKNFCRIHLCLLDVFVCKPCSFLQSWSLQPLSNGFLEYGTSPCIPRKSVFLFIALNLGCMFKPCSSEGPLRCCCRLPAPHDRILTPFFPGLFSQVQVLSPLWESAVTALLKKLRLALRNTLLSTTPRLSTVQNIVRGGN